MTDSSPFTQPLTLLPDQRQFLQQTLVEWRTGAEIQGYPAEDSLAVSSLGKIEHSTNPILTESENSFLQEILRESLNNLDVLFRAAEASVILGVLSLLEQSIHIS